MLRSNKIASLFLKLEMVLSVLERKFNKFLPPSFTMLEVTIIKKTPETTIININNIFFILKPFTT